MADSQRKTNRKSSVDGTRTAEPSRLLQRRRPPASLQISPPPVSQWNAAIPLLSPLNASPTAAEMRSREEQQQPPQQRNQGAEATAAEKTAVVFKKWQHPAAPFCYEPAPFVPSFFMPA